VRTALASSSLALAAFMLAAPGARADTRAVVEVISHRPDAVSITLYRDLFALITETRTVDLPDGAVTLSFEGVVETLLPASAVVAETGRDLEERNYDYDELSPNSLFEKSIGREIVLTRTLPGTGKVVRTPATIVAANSAGITLRTTDGLEALHCSGLPEQVTFTEIPGDLHAKPKLSVRLGAGAAGKRTVRLSYLAHGFTWKSDYVARLDDAGKRADLKGWLTLTNATNASFRAAQVQVVAGNLNLLGQYEGGTSVFGATAEIGNTSRAFWRLEGQNMLSEARADSNVSLRLFGGCHALPVPDFLDLRDRNISEALRISSADTEELQEIVTTGFRASSAEREDLADYQLYRLPWPTDLNARQTKQAVFLHKPRVTVERFYRQFVDAVEGQPSALSSTPELTLGIENRKSSGLGEPLPEGILRLYEPGADGDLFSGEGSVRDTAVGVPIEIALAGALDLALEYRFDHDDDEDEDMAEFHDAEIRIANAKEMPVTVEIRQQLHEDTAHATVARSNHRTKRKFGDFAWRVKVPANAASMLSYRLRLPEPAEEDED
jgi:hypothetical protein